MNSGSFRHCSLSEVVSKLKILSAAAEDGCIIAIIITLFKSQGYVVEHQCSANWGDYKSTEIRTNQSKCWFFMRRENGVPREHLLHSGGPIRKLLIVYLPPLHLQQIPVSFTCQPPWKTFPP